MKAEKIDLRSDTVTKPSAEMREAMFSAPVGDDVFGEDPSINALEKYVAELFGKEAALFCASGTQTNQIAIQVHVRPGGEVICHEETHIYKYEGGGIAKNAGASVRLLQGNRGRMSCDEISQWINNPADVHLPLTQLVSLEDTANRGGGAIYDFAEIQKIAQFCQANKLPLHLDGARLLNRLVASPIDYKLYAAQFDSISICLSKGLGAPVGSLLLGSTDFIHRSRRVRKVMGGGMRQAGFLATAGMFALQNNVARLADDHRRARIIGTELLAQTWVDSVIPVDTNIVVAVLKDASLRDEICAKMEEKNIRVMAFGPGMIRMVTHLDFTDAMLDEVISAIRSLK